MRFHSRIVPAGCFRLVSATGGAGLCLQPPPDMKAAVKPRARACSSQISRSRSRGLVRRVRYRRSAKTSTTMITMTTIVPIPIYTVIPLMERLQFMRCYPLRVMQTIRPALCSR